MSFPVSRALGAVKTFAAFGGVAAVLAFAPAAQAVPVVSPAVNVSVPVTTAGIYINVLTGAAGTAAGTAGWDVNPWGSGSLFVYSASTGGIVSTATTAGAVRSLPLGTVVGPASVFATGPSAATAANGWALNSLNYFGFRFVNEGTGATHYGYGSIQVGASFTDPARRVVNLWYESSPNTAITVAAIPEPGTWALMAAGLLGVAALARRRQQS